MNLLGFDTATPATVVALLRDGAEPAELRHEPAPGERPGHASQLLPLASRLLDEAGLAFADLDRIAVGLGPGTFTGLRIGVATARALAQATGAEPVGVSTLRALAAGTGADPVLAVLDARRGEAFVAGWAGGREVVAPAAVAPEDLARLDPPPGGGTWLAAGDGAIRFRSALERAGSTIPPDDDAVHRVSAAALCRLAAEAQRGAGIADLVPQYLRVPDADLHRQPR